MKVKFNKPDGQTNLDKYRVTAHMILKKCNDIQNIKKNYESDIDTLIIYLSLIKEMLCLFVTTLKIKMKGKF